MVCLRAFWEHCVAEHFFPLRTALVTTAHARGCLCQPTPIVHASVHRGHRSAGAHLRSDGDRTTELHNSHEQRLRCNAFQDVTKSGSRSEGQSTQARKGRVPPAPCDGAFSPACHTGTSVMASSRQGDTQGRGMIPGRMGVVGMQRGQWFGHQMPRDHHINQGNALNRNKVVVPWSDVRQTRAGEQTPRGGGGAPGAVLVCDTPQPPPPPSFER